MFPCWYRCLQTVHQKVGKEKNAVIDGLGLLKCSFGNIPLFPSYVRYDPDHAGVRGGDLLYGKFCQRQKQCLILTE